MDKRYIKAGDRVKYDGRAQGIQEGVVVRRVRIKKYAGGGFHTYLNIKGAGLLVPAEDVLEVL